VGDAVTTAEQKVVASAQEKYQTIATNYGYKRAITITAIRTALGKANSAVQKVGGTK
jgi:hypothetical protein